MQTSTKSAQIKQPETPTRWLCRLGPWKMEFEEGQENEVAEWAQDRTQYHSLWGSNQRIEYGEEIAYLVAEGVAGELDLFGRIMRLFPLPLKSPRKPLSLPVFYPIDAEGEKWTDVEVEGVVCENGDYSRVTNGETPDCYSVYLRLERGGCVCVADLATREQANSLAAIIMSGATWFVPAK